jgi:hypothetical protein
MQKVIEGWMCSDHRIGAARDRSHEKQTLPPIKGAPYFGERKSKLKLSYAEDYTSSGGHSDYERAEPLFSRPAAQDDYSESENDKTEEMNRTKNNKRF